MGRTLGLIAGSGRLPFEILEAAGEHALDVAVVALEGNADPELERAMQGATLLWNPPGQLARTIAFLKESGAVDVILAGAVMKRDAVRDLASLRLDARALALLARVRERGDDALLRAIAQELESEGFRVVESTRYLAGRLTPEGRLAGGPLEPRVQADLELGLRVAQALGVQDVGQSVVVKEGTVLAVEAIEGTDATMLRGAQLGGAGAVVVKAAKPTQDLRFDLPAIGASTLELARDSEIVAIGLEAGRSIVLDRVPTLALAERYGIAVIGLGGPAR